MKFPTLLPSPGYGSSLLLFAVGKAVLQCCQLTCVRFPPPAAADASRLKAGLYFCYDAFYAVVFVLGFAIFAFNFVFCFHVLRLVSFSRGQSVLIYIHIQYTSILNYFLLVRVWLPDFADPSSASYCDQTLYVFSFVYVVFTLSVCALLLALCCCCCSVTTCLVCTQM